MDFDVPPKNDLAIDALAVENGDEFDRFNGFEGDEVDETDPVEYFVELVCVVDEFESFSFELSLSFVIVGTPLPFAATVLIISSVNVLFVLDDVSRAAEAASNIQFTTGDTSQHPRFATSVDETLLASLSSLSLPVRPFCSKCFSFDAFAAAADHTMTVR